MKDKITKTFADAKVVSHNFTRLAEAAALIAVASYTIYKNLPANHDVTVATALLLVAGAIIGLRGAWEFLAHLAQK